MKGKIYDLLIFIQAPADLRYALNICETNNNIKSNKLLCVVNVPQMYDFVCSLSLENTEIVYFDSIRYNIWNPFTYLTARRKYQSIYNTFFKEVIFKEVYFFSRFFDWFTAGIVARFSNREDINIYYYNHYDDMSKMKNLRDMPKEHLKAFIISKAVSFMSRAKFTARYYFKNPEFKYKRYGIKKLNKEFEKIHIDKKHQYLLSNRDEKVVLFFISPEELDFFTHRSEKIIVELLKSLKGKGYFLCIKGHPRLGVPEHLLKFFDINIPSYIPSEFIAYKNVEFVVGTISIALSYPLSLDQPIPAYSLIRDLEFKSNEKRLYFEDYLKKTGKGKIKFKSVKDF